jgi:hypothetical protein
MHKQRRKQLHLPSILEVGTGGQAQPLVAFGNSCNSAFVQIADLLACSSVTVGVMDARMHAGGASLAFSSAYSSAGQSSVGNIIPFLPNNLLPRLNLPFGSNFGNSFGGSQASSSASATASSNSKTRDACCPLVTYCCTLTCGC